MLFSNLRQKIKDYPVFSTQDIIKWYPKEDPRVLRVQLSSWVKKGYLKKLKKDLFWFVEVEVKDNFYIIDKLLSPSYISLETALNYYGIIPDVPFTVTCVAPLATRTFKTPLGTYRYHRIKQEYFFGWQTVYSDDRENYYNIATPEKALLDFIYFNLSQLSKLTDFSEERFSFDKDFRWSKFMRSSRVFSNPKVAATAKAIKLYYHK